MGEGGLREGEILKLGGDKSSIFFNTNRGWVAKGERGMGREVANVRYIRDESQNNNATKVDISCPNVKLPCKARGPNLGFFT